MTNPPLPPEIVAAVRTAGREAALALFVERRGMDPPPPAAAESAMAYADAAVEAALAAVFDGCKVREECGHRSGYWHPNPSSTEELRMFAPCDSANRTHRRLVITTPSMEVTNDG